MSTFETIVDTMNGYPNLRGAALSVLLAAFVGLLLRTSVARASTNITVTRSDDGINCGVNTQTPRCAIKAANAMGKFNTILFSPAVTLAPASTTITVTSSGDGASCGIGTETLRCAINDANSLGTFNTIQFSPTVTQVLLASTLPEITSQGTFINGALPGGGLLTIDAAGMPFNNVLVINASEVIIFQV